MTRGEIISLALKKAEASGLVGEARTLLNIAIERLATEFRFPFLLTKYETTISQGEHSIFAPADMISEKELSILSTGSWKNLIQLNDFEFSEINTPTTSGVPTYFYIQGEKEDDGTGTLRQKIFFDVLADKSYSIILRYYKKPQELSTEDYRNYDADVPVFPAYLLIDALVYELFEYMDDNRAIQQWQKLELRVARYLAGAAGLNAGQDRIRLSRRTFG